MRAAGRGGVALSGLNGWIFSFVSQSSGSPGRTRTHARTHMKHSRTCSNVHIIALAYMHTLTHVHTYSKRYKWWNTHTEAHTHRGTHTYTLVNAESRPHVCDIHLSQLLGYHSNSFTGSWRWLSASVLIKLIIQYIKAWAGIGWFEGKGFRTFEVTLISTDRLIIIRNYNQTWNQWYQIMF